MSRGREEAWDVRDRPRAGLISSETTKVSTPVPSISVSRAGTTATGTGGGVDAEGRVLERRDEAVVDARLTAWPSRRKTPGSPR